MYQSPRDEQDADFERITFESTIKYCHFRVVSQHFAVSEHEQSNDRKKDFPMILNKSFLTLKYTCHIDQH